VFWTSVNWVMKNAMLASPSFGWSRPSVFHHPARVSVVVPALNEEACLGATLASVLPEADEVVVVDGGSTDATVDVATKSGAHVIEAPRGRGLQLDAGARRAGGEWLVFLHADTRLEAGWSAVLRRLEAGVIGGAFRFTVDAPRRGYRLIEAGVHLRCRLFRLPYGDQGVFVRRATYESLGGFAPYPLMEDVEFVRRLGRAGALAFPSQRAFTSPRRWEREGLIATSLRNGCLLALYAAGWSPHRLARYYGGRSA
jgi:rSAM/selenodomain-associated transferase 2